MPRQVPAPNTESGQRASQPGSGLVDFPIGHAAAGETDRHRLRCTSNLVTEQCRDRGRARGGLEVRQYRPVAPPILRGALSLVEQVEGRETLRGVGRHRRQNSPPPRDEAFDAACVEHIGAEFHRPNDSGGFTFGGPAFSQGERQIHAGGLRVHRQRCHPQVPQVQTVGGAGVLPRRFCDASATCTRGWRVRLRDGLSRSTSTSNGTS